MWCKKRKVRVERVDLKMNRIFQYKLNKEANEDVTVVWEGKKMMGHKCERIIYRVGVLD